jgi:hypothetical protein
MVHATATRGHADLALIQRAPRHAIRAVDPIYSARRAHRLPPHQLRGGLPRAISHPADACGPPHQVAASPTLHRRPTGALSIDVQLQGPQPLGGHHELRALVLATRAVDSGHSDLVPPQPHGARMGTTSSTAHLAGPPRTEFLINAPASLTDSAPAKLHTRHSHSR